jgi:SEC-C motif-containing protein
MSTLPTALPKPQRGQPCPCGSGQLFEACCEPILTHQRPAATAEQLMRSRFTAHVAGDEAHLHRTYQGTASQPYVATPPEPTIPWTRLVIHAHEPGSSADQAFVDFTAFYLENNVELALQEKAEFRRTAGEWIYTRAVRHGPAPVKLAQPKPGRNDPCTCGSGKKYKHCCLLKSA